MEVVRGVNASGAHTELLDGEVLDCRAVLAPCRQGGSKTMEPLARALRRPRCIMWCFFLVSLWLISLGTPGRHAGATLRIFSSVFLWRFSLA